MEDYILIAILLAIVGAAIWYIVKSKKSGKKCIGCPDGCCSQKQDGSPCQCCCNTTKEEE